MHSSLCFYRASKNGCLLSPRACPATSFHIMWTSSRPRRRVSMEICKFDENIHAQKNGITPICRKEFILVFDF
jgi:hypothetical protein